MKKDWLSKAKSYLGHMQSTATDLEELLEEVEDGNGEDGGLALWLRARLALVQENIDSLEVEVADTIEDSDHDSKPDTSKEN